MITVSEAEQIILSHRKDYGVESVPFLEANGRVLAEDILADRDLPPYDRVTMDGIAIRYADHESGNRLFRITATQAAGDAPILHLDAGCCLEIMTGAACSGDADTVIPYEKIQVSDGVARIIDEPVARGQNIHRQGQDRRQGETVMTAGHRIGPAHISMAASVGKSVLQVKKAPRIVIVSSGDELVEVTETPLPYQIRRSNNYSSWAVLK